LALLPGAAHAVGRLNAAGIRTILVTNQRWLSGPSGGKRCYEGIHARLKQLLAAQGAWLDAAYHCPHAAAICDCRKPGPGMLQRAADEHRFSLANAVLIGDSETDMMAGRAAGTATILLHPGEGSTPNADAVVNDLPAAVHLILSGKFSRAL
jgi:D-glycero-D-manno-heptose 1,7-bisphosphate phosphatase